MTTNDIDARTIAANLMTTAARDVDRLDVWGHIGKAYDVLTIDENIDIQVLDLISKASIDLIWPDGSKDTELDTARVEIERLRAELIQVRDQLANVRRLCDDYKDQPPPIFRGPGLSEHGVGYNAGTRDLARAVLSYLDGAEAVDASWQRMACEAHDQLSAERDGDR